VHVSRLYLKNRDIRESLLIRGVAPSGWAGETFQTTLARSERRSDGHIIIDLSDQLTSFRNFLESMVTAY